MSEAIDEHNRLRELAFSQPTKDGEIIPFDLCLSDYISSIPEAEPLTLGSLEKCFKNMEESMAKPIKWVAPEELKAMYPGKNEQT